MSPKPEVPSMLPDRILVSGWILPFMSSILLGSMLITVYVYAVYEDHMDPKLPLVSEAAALPPQAGYFAQYLTLLSFIQLPIYLLRHEQVRRLTRPLLLTGSEHDHVVNLNRMTTILGLVHAVLFPSVANFRMTEFPHIHGAVSIILIAIFNINVLLTSDLSRFLADSRLETKPTTMVINSSLLTMSVALFGSSMVAYVVERPQAFGVIPEHFSQIHNVTAMYEWLMFAGIGVHMLCLTSRMRAYSLNFK